LLGDSGSALFNLVLGFAGVIGFLWLVFGVPLGLIDLARRNGVSGYNGENNAAVLLGGFVVLAIVFSAYALVFMLKALLGIDLVGSV
jgi:hypothetical protein